jgi:hypothetical protein
MGGDDDDGDAIAETQEISSENLFHKEGFCYKIGRPGSRHQRRHGVLDAGQRLLMIAMKKLTQSARMRTPSSSHRRASSAARPLRGVQL